MTTDLPPLERLVQINQQRRSLTLPQLQLSYLEWNAGSEPVLLLHGLADHGLVWANLAATLGPRYHCVAPDLRGHGDSSKPDRGYTCQDMIGDLVALLNHLNWDATHLIAHSWSAKIATVWATQQPQRIRSLVLVDPFFIDRLPVWMGLTFPLLYRTLPFLKMMGPFDSWQQAEQQAKQLKQYRGWSDWQQAVFQFGLEQKSANQWGSKFVQQARNQIFADVVQTAGLTQPLTLPTLFIQPQAGLNRTAWQLQPYRKYLKALQIQAVPGNHWCFLVEPDGFNSVVAAFLSRL
jgi:pimeloyl-ACP methyl ester carboxylesterase